MGTQEALRHRLREERQAIQMRLARMVHQVMNGFSEGQHLSHGDSRDVLEQAEDRLVREQNTRLCKFLTARLKTLDQAWESLQGGTYGSCRLCGRQIPQRRLQALPAATFCVPCQEVVE